MNPPDNVQLIKGEIADYFLDSDGILYSYSKNPRRTVKNILENIALVRSITNNKKVPLLIYLSKSPVPDKETRDFVNKELPNVYTAMALISKPGLSKFIMNFLFSLRPPPIPMRSFTDDKEAKMWLTQYL
ncbi:MAG: STAS/SEC14 domain-containing protein [Bacteroidia bacterium]|nr:STAS/SEC14 domain-containing protein [Bacteroidia bacterium]